MSPPQPSSEFSIWQSTSETTGLLIVCHGSPLRAANEGFIALVGRIAARLGMGNVLPAFFALLRPNIQDQIAELASRGVTASWSCPTFFSRAARRLDIPESWPNATNGSPA